jgi:hypothetical protein
MRRDPEMKTTPAHALPLVAVGLLWSSGLFAQEEDRFTSAERAAMANIAALKVTLALNSPNYLPREEIRATVTLKNPTAQTLSVPDPFGHPYFNGFMKNGERTAEND